MLRAEDNKFLTESGAGTAMGELLRRSGCLSFCRRNCRKPTARPKRSS
jgi:phthalate 4,5-dioxygenase oxygenase subunit